MTIMVGSEEVILKKDYEWECFVKVLPASYRYKVWAETEEEARDLANSAFYDDYGNVERQVEEVNRINN